MNLVPPPPPPPPSQSRDSSSLSTTFITLSIADVQSGDYYAEIDSLPEKKPIELNDDDDEEEDDLLTAFQMMSFSDDDEKDEVATSDDDSSPTVHTDTDTIAEYDSEDDYCPGDPAPGEGKVDHECWDKYLQQIHESEGFDIKDYPGGCFMTTIWPMRHYLKAPKNIEMLKDYAGKALKLYNDNNGTHYEVEEILKLNGGGCPGFIFYITLSVKTCDGDHDIFQAKVVEHIGGDLEFPIIRPRAKKDVDI